MATLFCLLGVHNLYRLKQSFVRDQILGRELFEAAYDGETTSICADCGRLQCYQLSGTYSYTSREFRDRFEKIREARLSEENKDIEHLASILAMTVEQVEQILPDANDGDDDTSPTGDLLRSDRAPFGTSPTKGVPL